MTMHSSRGFFVSGHEQQIFLPLFPSFGGGLAGGGASAEVCAPMFVGAAAL